MNAACTRKKVFEMEKKIKKNLKQVIDPETGVSIVDMGFIYNIKIDGKKVDITMTLTTPGCPLHSSFIEQVEEKTLELDGIDEVEVETIFDPPWKPEMMSERAKKKLGYRKD